MKTTINPPAKCDLGPLYGFSFIVAMLMAGASVAGLLFPACLYPTAELRQSFIVNDVINLCIGLPLLLGAMGLARRGKLVGLLFWPGALFYVTYNSLAYAVALPLTGLSVLHLALVVSSGYVIVRLIAGIDGLAVQQRLSGAVKERLAGGVLVGLGGLFFLRAAGLLATAFINRTPLPAAELGVLAADLLVTPLWVVGGVALWHKRPLGYVGGPGLLFQASMLFVGLLAFFLLQPWLAGVAFPAADFVVILSMGMLSFVPLGLFARGITESASDG